MSKRSIVLPEIQYPDIVNYLENTVSAYTLNDMKAYKSLESYNQMVCGWVKEIRLITFRQNCLVSARVRLSKNERDPTSSVVDCRERGKRFSCALQLYGRSGRDLQSYWRI